MDHHVSGRVRAGALLLLSVLLALVAVPWSAAQAVDTDRQDAIRTALADDGIYLESSPALGDPQGWEERLRKALKRSSLDLPVHVALWTDVPGLAPSDDFGSWGWPRQRRALGVDEGIVVFQTSGFPRVVGEFPEGPSTTRIKAIGDQADAVADELVAAAPEQFEQVTPVGWAWIFLRLSAAQAPTGQDLVTQLSGDTSLLKDVSLSAAEPADPEGLDYSSPLLLGTAGLVILGTIAVFVLRSRAGGRAGGQEQGASEGAALERDPMVTELTSLEVEREVAGLSEAIAASEVSPGQSAYDRAQACADAAAQYVDSPLDRDRVGVHLLVQDGHRALAGEPRATRCFFHPSHPSETAVRRGEVSVPTCRACARAVTKGRRPDSLNLADTAGEVRAYHETDDVWSATGYGALDERWARRALLAALEGR